MTAPPSSKPIRCSPCSPIPIRRKTARASSRAGIPSCNAPATPISRRWRRAARSRRSTRCAQTVSRSFRTRAAGPAPMTTRSTEGQRASRAAPTVSCRCCIPRCSIRSTTITASRRSRRRRAPSRCTMPARPGPRRCSTTRPGPPARWSIAAPTAKAASPTTSSRGSNVNWRTPIRAPAMPGGRWCWKAASTGRA